MTTLQEKLEELMTVRDAESEARLAYKEAKEHWEASIGGELQGIVTNAQALVTVLEAEVRELALAEYHRTMNRYPAPGVQISVFYPGAENVIIARDLAMVKIQEKGQAR